MNIVKMIKLVVAYIFVMLGVFIAFYSSGVSIENTLEAIGIFLGSTMILWGCAYIMNLLID